MMQIGIEREDDGRWLVEMPGLSGVMVCDQTQAQVVTKVTDDIYQLEYRSSFTANAWLPLGGTVVGDGSRFCTNDAVLPGQAQRYYRLVVTNSP